MSLSDESRQSIREEETIFKGVATSLRTQLEDAENKLYEENKRARSLTSQIRETSRAEDKALLASDEAVSHGLKDSKKLEIERLKKQIKHPYFARIKIEEELDNGKLHTIEYKLGFSANIDLRIIDWRKAPISKLYYEYKEGEEFIEEILDRERIGKILLRNRIEVENYNLVGIENRHGSFHWDAETASWKEASRSHRGSAKKSGQLPEVLSLITPEQFRSITVDANSAILIQGIAGSGKTTVALHRIAWLLHEDNSDLKQDGVLCIVRSPVLRSYIENSLPSVGLAGLSIKAYHEWACSQITSNSESVRVNRPSQSSPLSIRKTKRSFALLQTIENLAPFSLGSSNVRAELEALLLDILQRPNLVLEHDSEGHLTPETINQTLEHSRKNFSAGALDWEDDALLLRIRQLSNYTLGTMRTWDHIMVDEVQDLSPVELATLIGAVKSHKGLTLVGDTSQSLDPSNAFPGWKRLCSQWQFTDDMSQYISLEVSHRSTLPIMRLADYVQGHIGPRSGRAGRTPIWFRCKHEAQGIEYGIKWLNKATKLYPNSLVCVLCPNMREAHTTFRLLEPTFRNTIRLGEPNSFSFDEGIVVTDVAQVKGLEFHSVLLWNPSRVHYPTDTLGRNSLYVAITRAEENLCIVSWTAPSKALPPFYTSPLIRRQDVAKLLEEGESEAG